MQITGSEQMGYTGTKDRTDCYQRLPKKDVPLMESAKIKGGDSSPPVIYMLNEGCNPVLTTGSPEATGYISVSHVAEEAVEEEEEEGKEEEEDLMLFFVMDQEQIRNSLCAPVERARSEQPESGHGDPENRMSTSEGKGTLTTQEDLSWNCHQEELVSADSQSTHQPSFLDSTTPARTPRGTTGQERTHVLPAGLPKVHGEDTLRTNIFLAQEQSTYECHQVSRDISKEHQDAEPSKQRSDEDLPLQLETRHEKEKGYLVVIEAQEEMSSKIEGTGRMEPSPLSTDEKNGGELREQREDVKLAFRHPSSEFPEDSRIKAGETQTTPNGISLLLSSKEVNNHSDMGVKVEDGEQNVFIYSDLQLLEEEDAEGGTAHSLMETKPAKRHRDGGEVERLLRTVESGPAEMETVELEDTTLHGEEDLDWNEMEDEMKMEEEMLLLGNNDQEGQEQDMQTQKTSQEGAEKETAAPSLMLGLATLDHHLEKDPTLPGVKENKYLVAAEGIPPKEPFASDSSLESPAAEQMASARLPAEGLAPASISPRALSPTCSGQWGYSGIYDQSGCVSCSGQDCEQHTERGGNVEEEDSDNDGEAQCVRSVDGEGKTPFGRDLPLTPEPQNLNDFQGMDLPVDGEINISATPVAGPLQNDPSKRDGPGDCVALQEEPDSIQELPKQNLPLPCQLDKAISGEGSALGRDETVQLVHKNNISSKGSQEDAQDSASEMLPRTLSGADEESINPSLVGRDETWDPELARAQDQTTHHKCRKHLEPHGRNFGFPGKEAEEDMPCTAQETSISDSCFLGPNRVGSSHNTDTDAPPDRCISDKTQLTQTLSPGSDSDRTLPPELASSHFCQPSSPTLDCRHSAPFLTSPSNGDFLAQAPDPTMDPTQPSQILEQLPPSSQTCQFLDLEPVSSKSPQSAAPTSAKELLDQPPASDFHQDCQLPDHLCNSKQSPSLEYDDHQFAPIPLPPKKHKHFVFPALNTKQDHQMFPSSPLPVFTFTTDPHNIPPTFHSHKLPSPDGKRSEETESSLPVRCMEANGHVRTSVHMADSISQATPPSDGSQNFKLVSNTDGGVEKLPLVKVAKLQERNAPRDQKGSIDEAPSDLEVSPLGARSDLIILNNDASVVNPTYGDLKARVTDMPDGTPTTNRISVESQKTPEAAEVQDSVQPPPLLAFTNPIHFLQLGPPSPPTVRHPSRQQAVFHGPHWRQQQQLLHNVKIDAGLTSVAEDAGKFRKGLEKPMVETIPAAVQRKEGLAKHTPLEKSTSCPNKNANRPDTKEAESNSRKQEVLLKLRSKSKDWHRQGLRKVSIPTDSALAEAIASLVPSKEEVPAHREKREHPDHVTSGEKKPSETFDAFIKRRCSKLIHSSELLYQKYSDDALNKAIQSQKSADSVPEDLELGSPNSPRLRRKALHSQDSYLHRLSVSSSTSLWQDIPMVRGSTMLLSMTHEEQKLQEAKFELIASEASYLRSLNVAVDHFQCSQELQAVLNNQEKQWLFSRLPDVRDVSANFLFDLEEKLEENMFNFNVCDVALSHAPEFRRVYLPYVTNQTYQQQTFRRLLNDVPAFQQVLEKLESDPICQRLSLKSFLILPFQRITRLKLLLQNILKRTPPGAEEELQATQAYDALEKLIKDCNENVQRMKNTEELIYLSQNMEFECKIFPLISQSRRLIKRGELLALEYNISLKWKLTTRPIYLHLFNDYLLLSRPRENGRFIVFDYAASSDVRGEKCEMKLHGANKNVFRLFLLQNSQGKKVEFLFRTETQSEKLRWISALAPQQAEPDLLDDSDAPQVQCVKPYKARENDELALEKADIIMVLQQSSDGWSEGVKLSDGERGWFPSEQVEPIASKEARRINLKEQLRVKNAKQQVFRRK